MVNTDPDNTAVDPTPDALAIPGLGSTPGVHFLTGTLRQLNTVWIDYGVTVTVGNTASQMTHNNILYFIDPQGRPAPRGRHPALRRGHRPDGH